MKRFLALLACVLLISGVLMIPAAAIGEEARKDQIIVHQTVEYVGDDCYYIETISVPSAQLYSSAKAGTKTAAYIVSGTTIYSVSVDGVFSFDGTTSSATSSHCTVATYVESATIISHYAYLSGASACGFGSVSYNGATLQKTVTLTCDKDGNLS